MKKATKKGAPRKSVKDLDVKPVKGGSVRGGITVAKVVDKSSATLYQTCATGVHVNKT